MRPIQPSRWRVRLGSGSGAGPRLGVAGGRGKCEPFSWYSPQASTACLRPPCNGGVQPRRCGRPATATSRGSTPPENIDWPCVGCNAWLHGRARYRQQQPQPRQSPTARLATSTRPTRSTTAKPLSRPEAKTQIARSLEARRIRAAQRRSPAKGAAVKRPVCLAHGFFENGTLPDSNASTKARSRRVTVSCLTQRTPTPTRTSIPRQPVSFALRLLSNDAGPRCLAGKTV